MTRVVIDTNVFLSAIFWGGIPLKIVDMAFSRKIIGVISIPIAQEIEEKLMKKFGYPKEQTEKYLELIFKEFETVEPKIKLDVVEDKKDNKIIEAAVEGNAEFIITGDKHLLRLKEFRVVKIVTPKQYVLFYAHN